MATIKDISKHAGVSIASVSKVLNGNYSGVSAETKERILKISKELNYRPNRMARGLVKNQSKIIGLIVPDISNPYYADLAKGVEEVAERNDYHVLLCNTNEDPKKEWRYINMLIEYNTCGVILTGMAGYNEKSTAALKDIGIPFVTIDRFMADAPVSFHSNSQLGSYMATEYLIRMGHRRIAFIGGQKSIEEPDNRCIGYMNALRANGIEVSDRFVKEGSYQMDTGYLCTNQFFQEGIDFTAIACGNDLIAFGALKALRENGKDTPRDISLIGYDDIVLSSLFEPKLTTIRQDSYHMGKDVSKELLLVITGERTDKIIRSVEPELIIRDTVASV